MRTLMIVAGAGLVALSIWETLATVLTTGSGGGRAAHRSHRSISVAGRSSLPRPWALGDFVETVPGRHVGDLEQAPPLPDVESLVEWGAPVDAGAVRRARDEVRAVRRKLSTLVS